MDKLKPKKFFQLGNQDKLKIEIMGKRMSKKLILSYSY